MKPLLDDFNPEMTSVYDECLKGIAHEEYIQSARHLKDLYGKQIDPRFTDGRYGIGKTHGGT